MGRVGYQQFHFDPAYEVSVDPESPGNGDWGCPVYGFAADGQVGEAFRSVWGTPLIIEVSHSSGTRWIGQYAAGGLGGVTGLCACPSPHHICAVVEGQAYLTDVRSPAGATVVLPCAPVTQVIAVDRRPLLLLASFSDLVALGLEGIAWKTPRLGLDGLQISQPTPELIECTVDSLDGTEVITIDASTGQQVSGRRFESYWPPDALA